MQEATLEVGASRVAQVRERLRHRAWAFDDPRSYTAGVDEALQALVDPMSHHRRSGPASSVSAGPRSNMA